MYKVIGIVHDKIKIDFSNNEEPFIFETKEEAEEFKQHIRKHEICPDGCVLEIETVKETSQQ